MATPPFAGNHTELMVQLIEAFDAARPTSFNETELYLALIAAVQDFDPGGGGGGNAGWTPYTLTPAAEPTSTLFTATTNLLITDFYPLVLTAFDGLTPNLDLFTGTASEGFLQSRGASPIPVNVAATEPGSNTGTLVSPPVTAPAGLPSYGSTPGAMSYSAAMYTLAQTQSPPALAPPIYVAAGTAVNALITQDGTNQTAVAAFQEGTSVPTLPFVVNSGGSPPNNKFIWTGSPNGSRNPEVFTVADNLTGYTTNFLLMQAIMAATGSLSGEPFSNYATVTAGLVSGYYIVTNAVAGAAGNGNIFGPDPNNDITVGLGFPTGPSLQGGLGGNPGSTVGDVALLVNSAELT